MKIVAQLLTLVLLLLFFCSSSFAAYLDPIVISNDGKEVIFQFSGDAGEPVQRMPYTVQPGTNMKIVREWVKDVVTDLDGKRAGSSLAGLQQGQTVTRLNRTAAVRAAKELWNEKLARYLYVKDAGIAASATELAAMKTDLETTYQAGFLTP